MKMRSAVVEVEEGVSLSVIRQTIDVPSRICALLPRRPAFPLVFSKLLHADPPAHSHPSRMSPSDLDWRSPGGPLLPGCRSSVRLLKALA